MYPDQWPNNHILNTLLSKYSIALFGPEQWAVRLPNLLGFMIYGFGVYKLLDFVLTKSSKFFIPFAIMLIANPYMTDFFALSRGYGLSIALSLFSITYLIIGIKKESHKILWLSWLFAMLSSYANFTLLVFWLAVSMVIFLNFLFRNAEIRAKTISLFAFIVLNLGYAALIFVPISIMQSTNQFEFWTANGFYLDTIVGLITISGMDSGILDIMKVFAYIGLFIICIVFAIQGLQLVIKKNELRERISKPAFIGPLVLFLVCFINYSQTKILGTPNLYGRTSLFLYPLFCVALLTTSEYVKPLIKNKILQFSIVSIMLFFGVFHTIKASNTDMFREWYYDGGTLIVLDEIRKDNPDEDVTLSTHWLFNPSFHFYKETGKVDWLNLAQYSKDIDTLTNSKYYYVRNEDVPLLSNRFTEVLRWHDNVLLQSNE